jgi:cytidine deaminase
MKSELLKKADEARKSSYSPYSKFRVGAALLTDTGEIYTGCNVECASYSMTCCAERIAFFKAVSEGRKSFKAIAITGGSNENTDDMCAPCGACRQVMAEFCNSDFKIILMDKGAIKVYTLGELLPESFTL